METEELEKGLNDIQTEAGQPLPQEVPVDAAVPPEYLSMDNLMRDYGPWFGNNKGLGETLLSELRANGVDTQAATEAMLRELLTGLVNDWKMLGQNLQYFQQTIMEQIQATQATANAVENALIQQGASPEIMPPESPVPPGTIDMPASGGELPPPPPADDMAAGAPPPADNAGADVPPAGGEELPSPPADTTSDARVKHIKRPANREAYGVLSDARYKRTHSTLNPNILAGCRG